MFYRQPALFSLWKTQMFVTYKIRTQYQYKRITKLTTSMAYNYYQPSINQNSSVWPPKCIKHLEINLEDYKYRSLNVFKLSVYLKEITLFTAINLTEVLSLMQPLNRRKLKIAQLPDNFCNIHISLKLKNFWSI